MKYKLTVWKKAGRIGLSSIYNSKIALRLNLLYMKIFKGVVRYEIKEMKEKKPKDFPNNTSKPD